MRRTGSRPATRTILLGLLAVVLSGLLAGCVSVPTSGRVERILGQQQSCQNCVAVAVAPPAAGDDPQQVVDGFLRANANYQPTYRVAREYLTRESAQSWSLFDHHIFVPLCGVARVTTLGGRLTRTPSLVPRGVRDV